MDTLLNIIENLGGTFLQINKKNNINTIVSINPLKIIKSYTLPNIQRKLILLFILNALDIIFTLILLSTGLFIEANIIMANIVESPIVALELKFGLIGGLIGLEYKRIVDATEKQLFWANIAIGVVLVGYVIINIMHVAWCLLYLVIQ